MDREDLDEETERELALLARRFCDEIRSGGSPSIEAYATANPALAELVRETFPALELLETCGRRFAAMTEVPGSGAPASRAAGPREVLARTLRRLSARGGPHDRYRIADEIGRGGQGLVLSVWDEDLRRNLAMKVLLAERAEPGSDTEPRTLGRFLEEAHLTAQLDHPGIVPVHELGLDAESRVYFTMKLVKGRDLRSVFELVRKGEDGWSQTRALSVLQKVCEAMAYAHSKGVIHRDLKPGNVMVGKFGEVYVMDWGLARVLGSADRKDIRIRPVVTSAVQSLRQESSDDPDSPLVTMDGDVVGTPAYMPPEQARGELASMGPHSDVYAVGAMLYHLLTGQMPYVPSRARLSNRTVWALVQEGPPEPVHALAADVPPELAAICDKAMAREVTSRYADMSALAEDLRAYLEHRVVRAYRTGALVELRKWIARNRGLATASAAAIMLALGGLGAVGYVQALGKRAADAERVNVLRLSGLQELKELNELAGELWPPAPEHDEACGDWLRRARLLVAGLEPDATGKYVGHRARLAELRAHALPYTDEDRNEDRRSHPRFGELARLDARIECLQQAQAVRLGRARPAEFVPDEKDLPDDASALNELVWPLVDPDRVAPAELGRGLALASHSVMRPTDDAELRANRLDTLAWACFVNGLDQEAMAASREALEEAPQEKKDLFRGYTERLRGQIDAARVGTLMASLEGDRSGLEAELAKQRTWCFETEQDRWLHAQLVELVTSTEALADPATGLIDGISPTEGMGIARRLARSASLAERCLHGETASQKWSEAIASISERAVSPAYCGLVIEPQFGLLPIGPDPRSGLWEFVNLGTGEPPGRAADGNLVLEEATGLVLVLIPGGTFWMGAQRKDPRGHNYDPLAEPDESPVREITLAPFFLSKFEMTQAQWLRSSGANPSQWGPGTSYGGKPHTLMHPVENMSGEDCTRLLGRLGLVLPTEAQWEYAARAGTETPWWTGADPRSMECAANVADAFFLKNGGPPRWDYDEWLDDGYAMHAPVGTYRPNAFGLYDVLGNVWEWCRGRLVSYWNPVRPGDGERLAENAQGHMFRGGGLNVPVASARSARRVFYSAEPANGVIGLRPALEIRSTPRATSKRPER